MIIFTMLLALAAGIYLYQTKKSSEKALKPVRIRTDEQRRQRRR
ncbi:MAG: hypothetical protein ACPGF7_06465 [Pontibacterium sp.]